MLKSLIAGALGAAVMLISPAAMAQNWPERQITIVVGQAAGAGTDIVARVMADELSKQLGQPVVVENRPGAGGMIAANAVRTSAPDGYMLYAGSATPFSTVFMKAGFDIPEEMAPVSMISLGGWVIYGRGDLGAKNLNELAEVGKQKKLKFASSGGPNHALMSQITKQLGFTYDEILYKATDQIILSLLSGDTDFSNGSPGGYTPHVESGKIIPLATLGTERSVSFPDVPTAIEQGIDFNMEWNSGLWAAKDTPKEVLDKIAAAVAEAVKSPELIEKYAAVTMRAKSSTPQELVDQFNFELDIYRKAMTEVGLTAQ